MTNMEYLWRARQDFIEAGEHGHYACPADEADGLSIDGRLCVAFRAAATEEDRGGTHFPWLESEWHWRLGELMVETNERGYAAVVAAYDQLCAELTLASIPTTTTNPQEVVPA